MPYTCPVCGFPDLDDPPRSPVTGGGSYEICPSCGFQFGVHDDDRDISYESWRSQWIADGMPWRDATDIPEDWNPHQQFKTLSSPHSIIGLSMHDLRILVNGIAEVLLSGRGNALSSELGAGPRNFNGSCIALNLNSR